MTAPITLDIAIGVRGVARLTGYSVHVVGEWRNRSRAGLPLRNGLAPMPAPCAQQGRTTLWYSADVVDWAARERLIEHMPQHIPAPEPLLTVAGVAKWAKVLPSTAASWRSNMRRHAEGSPLLVTTRVRLPLPDLVVEGIDLWRKTTIKRWWDSGKLVSDV